MLVSVAAVAVNVPSLGAQEARPLSVWGEVFVNSELERYLRLLQVTGDAPLYPWSVRGLSPREVDRLWPRSGGHPWAERYDLTSGSGKFRFGLIRPSLTTSFNTTFPYGSNDGPVWAGKGLTTAIQGGFAARYGPVSLILAPIAFRAENTDFELMPNGQTGALVYADGQFPTTIDRPQRFGDEPYNRLDPGQTTLRLDLPIVALGVSTANQHWGPATEYPILLGNNAAGYPQVFLGTSEPLDLWLFKGHGRAVWGRLSQTPFASVPDTASRRFMAGVVGVITPRGVPGLELGAARFFHVPWPTGGLRPRNFFKPFQSILLVGQPNPTSPNPDNQLASVFGRWVFPGARFELYGEYGREDHNWDVRDLILEPDHSAGYMLGFRRVWRSTVDAVVALKVEVLDIQASHLIRSRRDTPPFYQHYLTRQGHTHLGQLLGAAPGLEGAGTVVALERHNGRGRWTVHWKREVRQASGAYWLTGVRNRKSIDAIHALGGQAFFARRAFDITAGIEATYNFNRDFNRDAFNLNAQLGVESALSWSRPGTLPRSSPTVSPEDERETPASMKPVEDAAPFLIGSEDEDRHRVAQLLGARSTAAFLIRSLSQQWDRSDPDTGTTLVPIPFTIQGVWNSGVPFSTNDGAMWAARGASARILAGVRFARGPLSLTFAPQLVYAQNREFEQPDPRLTPVMKPGRSSFASPWYNGPGSIDQPLRFGDGEVAHFDFGQSTLAASFNGFAVGVSTEEQWWGPGIQSGIVISNNAPGFPHLFLRTARPVRTKIGSFEGRWLVAGLSESKYFDLDPTNDLRSLSALAVTWTPTFEPGLTLGAARVVYAPASGWDDVLARWPNVVFTDPGRPDDRPPSDSSQVPGPDQIYSLFGRWVFPGEGFEVYGEWSRTELPSSFRDLLVAPNHTRGFTLGFQWATPVGKGSGKEEAGSTNALRGSVIRLQGELTYLEESPTFRDRSVGSYYTSRAVIQGYTHRGQVIGAAVGPGGSGQWLGTDYLAPLWRLGLFAGRIRWNNDILYTLPEGSPGNHFCMHDVSIYGGLRAGVKATFGDVTASFSTGTRMNIHFQNFTYCSNPDGSERTYVPNQRIEVAFTRAW